MDCALKDLPNEIEPLKEMVYLRDEEIELLREQVRLLKAKLYQPKSEKGIYLVGQEELFPHSETAADQPAGKPDGKETVKAHKRKRKSRKFPDDIERRVELIDIPDEEKNCCGIQMAIIDNEVTEKLVYKKAECYVLEITRPKRACLLCEGLETEGPTVKVAPLPAQIIPKSFATPSLLAHIFTSRFVDALPYYRQVAQFARLGVEVSRANMSNWALQISAKCLPLLELLKQTARAGPMIGIDETVIQVLREPGRADNTKSYMWVIRGGPPTAPILLFQYHPTRSGKFARQLLEGYQGYVQTDGYVAYDFLDKVSGVFHLGCWAHVRRKFVAVIKAQGKNKKRKSNNAGRIVRLIKELYAIEKQARKDELSDEDLLNLRQRSAKPVLDKIKALLDDLNGKVPPKALLGNAINYALDNWARLVIYLDQPFLTPDNNLVENAIRPFVIGRKNWMFAGSPAGAKANAVFYTLIETAKANGWSPYTYLNFLLERLANAHSEEDYLALLPTNPPITE